MTFVTHDAEAVAGTGVPTLNPWRRRRSRLRQLSQRHSEGKWSVRIAQPLDESEGGKNSDELD